jgi:hypothetical protein
LIALLLRPKVTEVTNGNPVCHFCPNPPNWEKLQWVPEPNFMNFPAQPDEFVGRNSQIEGFRQVLAQGLLTSRTPSFAVLGDWAVGKSSLLLKYSAICSRPQYAILPVFLSVSTELCDYKCFAECLLDTRKPLRCVASQDTNRRFLV